MVVVPARQAGNRFLGSLKGLQIRALGGKGGGEGEGKGGGDEGGGGIDTSINNCTARKGVNPWSTSL
jgi:hypothetical protein